MRELSLNNCRLDKRYDVRGHLGRGSYAEIYLAHDNLSTPGSTNAKVVIKALNVFLQNDLDPQLERTLVENFQNEAIALDRVRHPNVISRIGHGTARDLNGMVFHYLVLEYLAGGDLQSLIRREKLSLDRALNYIEQICSGVAHAHSKGVIHRDLKPQNLLLTRDLSTVKIADFGVARVNVNDDPITRVGTNIYAPPEHSPMSAGKTGGLAYPKLTPAADVYSLAKTAYTVITGEAPRDYANQQITDLPEWAAEEEWAEKLARVLRKATSDDPRERHRTVEELWSDLATVRQAAGGVESTTTTGRDVVAPRPYVSRGYSPVAPSLPSFEAIAAVPSLLAATGQEPAPRRNDTILPVQGTAVVKTIPHKKRRRFQTAAVFAVFLTLFTGILYGTASYMRGRGVLPEFRNPFAQQIAVANTDIYLRPGPNTDSDPIGLVTKNSKVRIVNEQNNWYQVDVVQQGRARPAQDNATRGWLNGRYLDLGDN